jgi:hypothetical protein
VVHPVFGRYPIPSQSTRALSTVVQYGYLLTQPRLAGELHAVVTMDGSANAAITIAFVRSHANVLLRQLLIFLLRSLCGESLEIEASFLMTL